MGVDVGVGVEVGLLDAASGAVLVLVLVLDSNVVVVVGSVGVIVAFSDAEKWRSGLNALGS